MGRKNKKKKTRNNGSSSTAGGNINNYTIPDVATTAAATTTTSVMRFTLAQLGFTKRQMKKINEKFGLQGYPKSREFASGYKRYLKHEHDEAIALFILGATTVGCVACMFCYANLQQNRGNEYLGLPFYFEAAIRGHTQSINGMVHCYIIAKPEHAFAFQNFWVKIMIELRDTVYTTEERLAAKKPEQIVCANCGKESDYEDMTSKKWCGGCRYYSYCGQECQRQQWKNGEGEGNHMGECRQLKILKHHYRRYAKDIREAIMRGDDPKTMERLQALRTLLGLNRPKEEYEELLVTLGADDKNDTSQSPNRLEYLTARKDGTVWIGSTPNVI